MRRFLLFVLVGSLAVSAVAQKKKQKQELPDAVLAAQYVYVTGFHGDMYDPNTPSDERQAINRVQFAMMDWDRYKVVHTAAEADIMLVVKAAKLGMVQGGGGIGGPAVGPGTQETSVGIGIGTGAHRPAYGVEGGSGGDQLMLSIFPKDDPQSASFVWRRAQNGGFQGRGKIPLLEELKKAVSESEKAKAANAKP